MKYQNQRWELTAEEQEKARFIMAELTRFNTMAQRTQNTSDAIIESTALSIFKDQFYRKVSKRLNIRSNAEDPIPDDAWVLTISGDGRTISGTRVAT